MKGEWAKRWPFMAGVVGVLLFAVGLGADLAQLLALQYGAWVLAAILAVALLVEGGRWVRRHWLAYRALGTKLDQVRDYIASSMGEQSTTVFLCATAHWLRQSGHSVCVRALQAQGEIVLDLAQVSLRAGDNLYGLWFSIVDARGQPVEQGQVKHYNREQAYIELNPSARAPQPGDLAIPIEPPGTTDLERLLGQVLYILSES